MSLRTRVMFVIILVMLGAVGLSGAVVIWNGRRQVHTELHAALEVANATVLNDFRLLRDRPDRDGVLRGLVRIFDGSRNIRAVLYDSAHRELAASRLREPGLPPPAWLVALLRPGIPPRVLPFTDAAGAHDIIVLHPSARNETSEVWANISDDTLFVVLFVGISLLLAWRLIGWILAPVAKLASGIADLRAGRTDRPIRTGGPRELRSLIAAFNGLVRDLAAREAEARRLEDQMGRIQEEERADLARDLHDDVGPQLFLAKIELDALTRHAALRKQDEIRGRLGDLLFRLGRIQDSLRDVLVRLRPPREVDDGLGEAVETLLARLRPRCPGVVFTLATEGDLAPIDARLAESAFRILREAVHNALRHGRPRHIALSIRHLPPSWLDVVVEDDGQSAAGAAPPGLGLSLMREQAALHGGVVTSGPGPDGGGWVVRAALPPVGARAAA
jgi:two-component system sensor histidine kinase UhpB